MTNSTSPLLVILPERLIDGLGNSPLEGMAVVVAEGSILWVGQRGEVENSQSDAPREILEFPGATLLPGLFDLHTHTNMPGDGRTGEEVDRDDTDDVRLLRSARNVEDALITGVTTLCDCGSWNRTAYSLKQGLTQGLVDGPRTLVSGPPLTITGGHLWFMGGQVDGVDAIRAAVRERVMQGADFIKVAASGGSTLTSDPYRASFTLEEVTALVDEAHNRNRPVLAHCRCTESINFALDAGVDAILHCFFAESDGSYRYDEPTADRLAESGVYLNPTMHLGRVSRAHLERIRQQRAFTPAEQERWERSQRMGGVALEQFRHLVRAGVRLAGGSDCGWGSYPFGDFQGEVVAMHDAGLNPMQAIQAGTRNPADALGILDQTGTIEPGKAADLLGGRRRSGRRHRRAAAGPGRVPTGLPGGVGAPSDSDGLVSSQGSGRRKCTTGKLAAT